MCVCVRVRVLTQTEGCPPLNGGGGVEGAVSCRRCRLCRRLSRQHSNIILIFFSRKKIQILTFSSWLWLAQRRPEIFSCFVRASDRESVSAFFLFLFALVVQPITSVRLLLVL